MKLLKYFITLIFFLCNLPPGLPDARLFPFIEPPAADAIEDGLLSLKKHVSDFCIFMIKNHFEYMKMEFLNYILGCIDR